MLASSPEQCKEGSRSLVTAASKQQPHCEASECTGVRLCQGDGQCNLNRELEHQALPHRPGRCLAGGRAAEGRIAGANRRYCVKLGGSILAHLKRSVAVPGPPNATRQFASVLPRSNPPCRVLSFSLSARRSCPGSPTCPAWDPCSSASSS